ncbi:MAG: hypothetical protein RL660_2692 [Bacteroidota bacterium]|jgi:hypothetical protein
MVMLQMKYLNVSNASLGNRKERNSYIWLYIFIRIGYLRGKAKKYTVVKLFLLLSCYITKPIEQCQVLQVVPFLRITLQSYCH